MEDAEIVTKSNIATGFVLVLVVSACVISGAVRDIVKSCEPSVYEECRTACSGRVKSVTDDVCTCMEVP